MRQGINSGDLTNRINKRALFADYTRKLEAARLGIRTPINIQALNGGTNQSYALQQMIEGALYTTAAEQEIYINQVRSLQSGSVDAPAPAPPEPVPSDIVRTDILIELDASVTDSYPGSGTTWTDICGTGVYNGTLIGTVNYSSDDGGILQLGATGLNYIEIANAAAIQAGVGIAITAQVWMKIKSFNNGDGIISKQFGGTYASIYRDYDGFSLRLDATNKLLLSMNGSSVNGNYASANSVFDLNTWTFFTVVVRFGGGALNPCKVYVNATEVISQSNAESGLGRHAPLGIGRGFFEDANSNSPEADIGAFYYYNRALTAAEIADNYNATKARYGIA